MSDAEPTRSSMCLVLAGDVMAGRGVDQVLRHPLPARLAEPHARGAGRYVRWAERVNGPIPRRGAPLYPWGDALTELARLRPDLFVVNLGMAITQASTAWEGKSEHLRMSPRHVACLADAGVQACTLANDHVLDWDHPGLRDTLAHLARAGLSCAGGGMDEDEATRPAALALPRVPSDGARLWLASWASPDGGVPAGWAAAPGRPGIALLHGLGDADARAVRDSLAPWKRAGDLAVVSLHWGPRDLDRVPAAHQDFARRLIDMGAADVVHGHGPLAPLPAEVYQGKLILHACGDLLNDLEGRPAPLPGLRTDAACLFAARLDAADGRLQALEIVPLQRRRFRLCHPTVMAYRWLIDRLDGQPAGLSTEVAPGADGHWRLRWRAG